MSLGCSDYRVFVHTRATLTRAIVEVPWSSITWGRVLDDTSAAEVQSGGECCDVLAAAAVKPWAHQLSIVRVGFDPDEPPRVWSGPITNLRDTSAEGLVFSGRDLSAWLDRRFVHDDQFWTVADLSDIYEAVWDDAMAPDPIEDYALTITPAGVDGDREILAEQHAIAGDVLRELGRTGIDWTVIDREHFAAGEEIDTPPLGPLIDAHFVRPPDVETDGTGQGNRWIVTGSGGGAEGDEVYGEATATPGPEGLLEALATEPEILDIGSADESAQSHVDRSALAPTYIREGALTPDAPVSMSSLVPGARVRLALSGRCLPVYAVQRLTSLTVTVTREGEGVVESVGVAFEPLGTTAA